METISRAFRTTLPLGLQGCAELEGKGRELQHRCSVIDADLQERCMRVVMGVAEEMLAQLNQLIF